MTLYTELTRLALAHGGVAEEAWAAAGAQLKAAGVGTESSRQKGCPGSAFVGLASGGYIRGLTSLRTGQISENARHVLRAYELLQADLTLSSEKGRWWEAVRQSRNIARQGQNGVLDVLLALLEQHALVTKT